jgi:hypothetical protein
MVNIDDNSVLSSVQPPSKCAETGMMTPGNSMAMPAPTGIVAVTITTIIPTTYDIRTGAGAYPPPSSSSSSSMHRREHRIMSDCGSLQAEDTRAMLRIRTDLQRIVASCNRCDQSRAYPPFPAD